MTPTPTLREALEEARQHVEFIADGGVESVAQLRAAIDLLPRIDAALSTPEPQGWRPAPIERDESFDRDYITLPAGWEIQTKGKGSSFRVCRVERDGESYERWLVTDEHLHPVLERMAREIRKALEPPQ